VPGEGEPHDLGFDPRVPNIARVYNYWLGGKDNFAADRQVGDVALQKDPYRAWSVRANRAFLSRVVRFLALEAGIRQFLDIGTGIPTANNTHEVAQAAARDCRIAYVDNDPVVLSHARALLRSTPEGCCIYIHADARDPETILREATRTLDFAKPIAIMLIAIMHCVPDADEPYSVVNRLLDAVPRGSYLALSHPASDINPEIRRAVNRKLNEVLASPTTLRNREQVTAFFDGLDLLEPGVVLVSKWRPDTEIEERTPTSLWGGIARKTLKCLEEQ
jgi:hypothetical protein